VKRHGKAYLISNLGFSLQEFIQLPCPECVDYSLSSFLPSFSNNPLNLPPPSPPLIKQKKKNPKGEEEEEVLASFCIFGKVLALLPSQNQSIMAQEHPENTK
jgi:hypothetical protein